MNAQQSLFVSATPIVLVSACGLIAVALQSLECYRDKGSSDVQPKVLRPFSILNMDKTLMDKVLFSVVVFLGYGFIYAYPVLQIATVLRCRSWCRVLSLVCMIPSLPIWILIWWLILDPVFAKPDNWLSKFIGIFYGPYAMLFLSFIWIAYEIESARQNKPMNESKLQ